MNIIDFGKQTAQTFLEPFALSQLTEAWISLTAPGQSRPLIKCCASAVSKPTFPRYKLKHEAQHF